MMGYFLVIGSILALGLFGAILALKRTFLEKEGLFAVAFMALVSLIFVSTIFLVSGHRALSSQARASVVNNALGTDFTAEQMFWAGDDISKLYYGDLRRFNVDIQGEDVFDGP